MEELKKFPKFHLQHCCKTNISRGREHYFGIYLQDTGFFMKFVVSIVQEIFRMLNQHAADIPSLQVNKCFSHLIQFVKEC